MEQLQDEKKGKKKSSLLYAILILALIVTWVYIYIDKTQNQQRQTQLETQIGDLDSSKSAVEEQFKATLTQLDFLKSENDSLMKTKTKEINDLKARIQSILQKGKNTEAELAQARNLIKQLEDRTAGYEAEIQTLKGEKEALTKERDSIKSDLATATSTNETLSAQNDQLSEKVSAASILKARNFNIEPIKLKNSGKEKTVKRARRTDLLRITFDIDNNLVAESGPKDLFICINDPEGAPIAVQSKGSGKFTLADGTEKLYTLEKTVDFETGKGQTVSVDWEQSDDYKKGDYTIEVYEQGHLIGEGSKSMK